MKILLLGGTAYFGTEIAKQLRDRGHAVTLFTRGNRKQTESTPFPHIQGDRTNDVDLKKAAEKDNWDVVIDNIAYNGADVTRALSAFPRVKKYILTSSIATYRFSHERNCQPLLENSVDYDFNPPGEKKDDPHWKYARGKIEAEKVLVRQTKVPWVITRPTIVYGPHDVTERGYWYLSRLLSGGPLLLANGGMNALRIVYSHDLAQLHVALVEKEEAIGRIFNVAQKEIITLKEFLEASALAMGVRPEFVGAPFETLGELAGPYAYDRSWIPDIEHAENVLGYRPTAWSEFAATTATWFRDAWEGDLKKFLKTREQELELARQWSRLARENRVA